MYPPDYSEREQRILEVALSEMEAGGDIDEQRVTGRERGLLMDKLRSHRGHTLLAVPTQGLRDDIVAWGTAWFAVTHVEEAGATSVQAVHPARVKITDLPEEVKPGWQERLVAHLNADHPGWGRVVTNFTPTPLDHEALHNEQCDHTHGEGAFRDPERNTEPAVHATSLTHKEEGELPYDAVVCDARGMVYRLVPRTERGKSGSQKRWLRDGQTYLFTHPARPLIRLDHQ